MIWHFCDIVCGSLASQVVLAGWEDPLEEEVATHYCILVKNSMDIGA